MITLSENDRKNRQSAMHTPPVVSPEEWKAAWERLLVEEKALSRSRDALAAERRRMPWLAVEKTYEFIGPEGKASLLDLFDGRRQLIVYRAFFEPGVFGWPDHRSEEHTSELQSLMRISYAVFCLKKKTNEETLSIENYNSHIFTPTNQ